MHIHVNGAAREVTEDLSLAKLIAILDLKAEQIAIELNHNVVRRAEWQETFLHAGDSVEIVHFVGGGCNANC